MAVDKNKYIGATTIQELADSLSKYSYVPRTEEQRRAQSENLYRNQRDQALLTAQQSYDTNDLALQNQLTGLGTATDRQIEAQREATRSAVSAADRHALARGMQRSSYNNAVASNIYLKGNKAEQEIQQNRTNTEMNIAAQRALLAQQLSQNRAAANSQYENAVLANMQQLEQQDYERALQADQLNTNTQLQLYQAQQGDAQLAQADRQFELNLALQREQLAENGRQFDLNLAFQREKAAGTGGTGGNPSALQPKQPPVPEKDRSLYDNAPGTDNKQGWFTPAYNRVLAKYGPSSASQPTTPSTPSSQPVSSPSGVKWSVDDVNKKNKNSGQSSSKGR